MSAEADFAGAIEDMLSREEYLFPYVWAQRRFRQDNYQMASQALLEDMFFDTLGDYLHRHRPEHDLIRRTGKESWDYTFDGQGFSHKEGISASITAVWQSGEGVGNRTPLWETWSFAEPVVFAYTRPSSSIDVTLETVDRRDRALTLSRRIKRLTYTSVLEAAFAGERSFVLFGSHDLAADTITVDHVWSRADWDVFDVHRMRQAAANDLRGRDGWVLNLTQADARRVDLLGHGLPLVLRVRRYDLPTGVYVFPRADLQNLPLESNNKAHFVKQSALEDLMRRAVVDGSRVPLPLWPSLYADLTPPNLYREQKDRYDQLFQART